MLEVLRFSTLIPIGIFHSTTQDVVVDEYLIPKDTLVVANIYAALRDPVWGDPENFRPESFLNASNQIVNTSHLLPFSLGKRRLNLLLTILQFENPNESAF